MSVEYTEQRPGDSIRVRVLSVVVIALLACLAVAHGWRKGWVLAPTDGLQLVAPWAKGEGYVARNEQLFDQTVQFVPWTIYTVERYRQGQIPLWNPYSQLGAPFVGNGQSAVFYPTILLHLKLPETWAWTISAALRLFVAGFGAYVLAGRYGLLAGPRLFSALAFMLCGFNVVWLNHPQMNVMPLLPWGIVMTEMLIERVRLHRVLGAALVFAVQFLGGHPASCIHLLLACGMVWVLRVTVARNGVNAGRAVGSGLALLAAVAFGFALAAAQWLPLLEYAENSGAKVVREERLANERFFAVDPRYLVGMAFPYANGFPDGVAPFEMRAVTHLPNTNELAAGYVGTVPLLLGIFGAIVLRRRRVVLMWIIVGVVAAAIAIRLPGVDHVVRHVPGLKVAQNARLLVVTALALALLAGFGLQEVLDRVRAGVDFERMRKIVGRVAIGLAGVSVLIVVGLLAAKGPILRKGFADAETKYAASTDHEHSLEYVKGLVPRVHQELVYTGLRLLIPAAVLGLVWLNLRSIRRDQERGGKRARHGGVWTMLAVAELLAFAIPFNPGSPVETYFPTAGAIEKLKELPAARVAGTYRTMTPETSTVYGVADIRGYDALAPRRYYQWWAQAGIGELDPSKQGYLSRLENPEHSAWGLLNFGYLMTPPGQAPPAGGAGGKFSPVEHGGEDARIYRVNGLRPRAWVAGRAEVYDSVGPVLDRVAKMDFDPDQVVLLDKEGMGDVPKEAWANGGYASGRGRTMVSTGVEILPPARGEEDRPEVVRLRVSGANGGYLVLADTFFPGWEARVSEGRIAASEQPILPAYGVMRAVPLPASARGGYVEVEMRYRPLSWRRGAMVSMMSVCLFVLLAGGTMFWKPRNG